MEHFLSWKQNNEDEDTVLPETVVRRDDDLLWCYCMDLTLFKNPSFDLSVDGVVSASKTIHEIGINLDCVRDVRETSAIGQEIVTGYAATKSYLLNLDGGDSLDMMYAGFSSVALVTDNARGPECGIESNGGLGLISTPASRIAALRRRMLINYGALTEASDALRAYVSTLLFASSKQIDRSHELLRVIIATLAMVKYDAKREVVEADDFETYAYGAFHASWGLDGQLRTLNALTEDADKATSRISEAVSHKEDKRFNLLILILTLVTLGGVASEVTEFIRETVGTRELSMLNLSILTIVWLSSFAICISPYARHRSRPVKRR